MRRRIRNSTFGIIFLIYLPSLKSDAQELYHEQYRPQIHFSPKEKWTNDPNGMVYYQGIYHLFFQYYPDSTVWGPMHWGHATSKDLVHWHQEPIALYPDSLGYIFSGSAVVDYKNTSGLGLQGQVPLVAIFTSHDPVAEKEHKNNYQNQSIAYSLDSGKTWVKYIENPVLRNPGITDFRDPKVMWYEPRKQWVMTLATKDRITFYSSPDLKNWKRESDFGSNAGAHGGVWECPDLFPLNDNYKKIWILIVNINPGGPNKGSATQYFIGNFDGHQFVPYSKQSKWLDYGPDEYAGITWSNTGNRKIFLGWMSNWLYANLVPTARWRNAMTIPRELKLRHAGKEIYLVSQPVSELNDIQEKPIIIENLAITKSFDMKQKTEEIKFPCRLNFSLDTIKDFSLVLSNDIGEQLVAGYDYHNNKFYIDRSKSGRTDFQQDFAAKHTSARFTENSIMNISFIIDVSSIELFADEGLTVMTEIFFPNKPYNKIAICAKDGLVIKKLDYIKYRSIWK